MSEKRSIYDDIKEVYQFPEKVAISTIPKILRNHFQITEEATNEIIEEYKLAKAGKEGHDLDTLCLKVFDVLNKNSLPIQEYKSEGKEEKAEVAKKFIEEFRTTESSSKQKYTEDDKEVEKSTKQTKKTLRQNPSKKENIPQKPIREITIEDLSTAEARDKLIIKLITLGIPLNKLLIKGIPLEWIERTEGNVEYKAFISLLRKRIDELSESIKDSYRVKGSILRKNDLKKVFDWVSDKKLDQLESKKQNIKRIIKPNISIDSVMVREFKDENGDFEIGSMIFVIENLNHEMHMPIKGYSERTRESLSDVVRQIIDNLKQNNRTQVIK